MEAPAKYDFMIAAPCGDKITHRVAELIRKNKPFAILMALSLLPEIDRKADGTIDVAVQNKRKLLPTLILSGVGKVWLINHPEMTKEEPKHSLFLNEQERSPTTCEHCHCDSCDGDFMFHTELIKSLDNLFIDGAQRLPFEEGTMLVQTRSQALIGSSSDIFNNPDPSNSSDEHKNHDSDNESDFESKIAKNRQGRGTEVFG
jgi:hypothetical protein